MENRVHTKGFSQMIGGVSSYKENGEWKSEPCPTTGEQIARYLEKNPEYELIDQIDVSQPNVINDHSVKAFFQPKINNEMKKEELEALKEKAKKWDNLETAIGKFYENTEGAFDEENPEELGDLESIGELAASATGWI